MAKLIWDEDGKRFYQAGVDRGVVYKRSSAGAYPTGAAWNGLTAINENPSGGEATALYANNAKYLDIVSSEEFGYAIEAYTYPDEFAECDGSKELAPGVFITQQNRSHFGLTYRTKIGNDTEGIDHGYQIHIVYDSVAKPASKDHATINESVEAATFSWECSTTPVKVEGHQPASHLVIDSTKCSKAGLAALEAALYGTDDKEAYLPLPNEIITLCGTTD